MSLDYTKNDKASVEQYKINEHKYQMPENAFKNNSYLEYLLFDKWWLLYYCEDDVQDIVCLVEVQKLSSIYSKKLINKYKNLKRRYHLYLTIPLKDLSPRIDFTRFSEDERVGSFVHEYMSNGKRSRIFGACVFLGNNVILTEYQLGDEFKNY